MKDSGLSKFVQATMAFLTGDTDTALALKNERLAKAAIRGQLSALEGQLVNDEVELDLANENFNKSFTPKTLIASQEGYIDNLLTARENLTKAEAKLEKTKKTIAFLEKLSTDRF